MIPNRVRFRLLSACLAALAFVASLPGSPGPFRKAFAGPDSDSATARRRPRELGPQDDPNWLKDLLKRCAQFVEQPGLEPYVRDVVTSKLGSSPWPKSTRRFEAPESSPIARYRIGWEETPGAITYAAWAVTGRGRVAADEDEVRMTVGYGSLVIEFGMASTGAQTRRPIELRGPDAFSATVRRRPRELGPQDDPNWLKDLLKRCAHFVEQAGLEPYARDVVTSKLGSSPWPKSTRRFEAPESSPIARYRIGWEETPGAINYAEWAVTGRGRVAADEDEVRMTVGYGSLVIEFGMASTGAQVDPSGSGDDSAPISPDQLRGLRTSAAFTAASDIILSDGQAVALETGRARPLVGVPGAYEARFPIAAARGAAAPEYATLVALVEPGKPPFVYFDDRRAAPGPRGKAGGGTPEAAGLLCSWGPWTQTGGVDCRYRWLCGKKNDRRGTFQELRRDCVKNGSVTKSQLKWTFSACGC